MVLKILISVNNTEAGKEIRNMLNNLNYIRCKLCSWQFHKVQFITIIEVEMYREWHWSYGRYPRGVWSGHHRASYRFPASRDGIVDPSTEKQNETICFLFHAASCTFAIFTYVTISFESCITSTIILIILTLLKFILKNNVKFVALVFTEATESSSSTWVTLRWRDLLSK